MLFAGVLPGQDAHVILTSRCGSCHTGDAAQAGLRMDSREALLRGGASGPAVTLDQPSQSLLLQRVTGKKGLRMPPTGPPLTEDAVATLQRWIEQGAPWPKSAMSGGELAAMAPRNPPLPPGKAEHPIDRFLPPAGKRLSDALFARRVYFDTWGFPPAPEDLAAFLGENDPAKRTRLIDRLLAGRKNYAEHWISFWNDLLRNDEGVIYHGERKSITAWLLAALEENLPYDRMVRALLNPEQKGDPDGFLTGVNWRGVVSASQSPPMQAAQNSAQVFLGINLKCAACHDSFVNRWKLADTYGLAAMFSSDKLELVRCDVPTGKIAEATFPIPGIKAAFRESLESRRAAAAEWFTSSENGRFARTLVNRYWRQLFGRGLVEPVDDMDAEPTNRDLLDWLASDFAGHGYDLQHLLRRITTSQAYQTRAAHPRRLTAEQLQDTISMVSGDWRVRAPRDQVLATYTREWRLKSDPLSRALGRPIRDQVYTERNQEPTTLQALELTNGPLLSERIERAALALEGRLPAEPDNIFDSKLMRAGSTAVDLELKGAGNLWLLVENVDSYDPARVTAGWVDAQLTGPGGTVPVEGAGPRTGVPWQISVKTAGATRFQAKAMVDESSRRSDIGPAVRFFVFTTKPNPERLVRIEGEPPYAPPPGTRSPAELVERLYLHLLSRRPEAAERRIALSMAGKPGGVEDLLWAMLMSPEFQYIR
jgi:hypothetical protein